MKQQEAGYTLIELMVGLLVGLIVLSAVVYMLLMTLSSSRGVFNSTKLNQELSTLNDLMTGELRRAGYWPAASGAVTSPFSLGTEEGLRVPSDTCVLYTYDADGSQSIEDSERLGFRLQDGGIDARKSGPAGVDCTSTGSWESITDDSFMDVSEFKATESSICWLKDGSASWANCSGAPSTGIVSIRELNIYLKANVVADPDWEGTINETIKVRNNKVVAD